MAMNMIVRMHEIRDPGENMDAFIRGKINHMIAGS